MYSIFLPTIITLPTLLSSTLCLPQLSQRNGDSFNVLAYVTLHTYWNRKGCKGNGNSYEMAYGYNITDTAVSYWLSESLGDGVALDWYAGGVKYPMLGNEKNKGCHDLSMKMGAFNLWVPPTPGKGNNGIGLADVGGSH